MYHHLKARKAKRAVAPPLPQHLSVGPQPDDVRISDGRRRKREQSDVCDAIITSFVLLCQSRLLEGGRGGVRKEINKNYRLWQTPHPCLTSLKASFRLFRLAFCSVSQALGGSDPHSHPRPAHYDLLLTTIQAHLTYT